MTGSLQLKKLKSGKKYYYIRLSYKDPHSGKWLQKEVSTKLEEKGNKRKAESMIGDAISKYSYLELRAPIVKTELTKEILLTDYIDYWLDIKQSELRTSAYEIYTYKANTIKRYFEPLKYRVIDITPQVADSFVRYMLKYGKVNKYTGIRSGLAVRTVRDIRNIMSAVMLQACIDGIISTNPFTGIHVHGLKNSDYQEEMLFLTEEEITELLKFISVKDRRLLPIAFMGVYYGLRRSEILGLKWNAIDFTKKTITISHTVVRAKSISKTDETKTIAGKRILNLFPTAEKCLLEIKQKQEMDKAFFGNTYKNKDHYIFVDSEGEIYNPDYISKTFKKLTTEFGRPEITLHKLRHSCASLLINKGWDIKKLQYWLGHKDTQTTLNIYSHFNKKRLNECADDLAEMSKNADELFGNVFGNEEDKSNS